MREEFQILAAKVLAREATVEEEARLQELLAADAELRRAFHEMESCWAQLQESGPLLEAMQSPAAAPIPPGQLARLQQKVKEQRAASNSGETGRQPAGKTVDRESIFSLLIQSWTRIARGSSPALVPLLLLFVVVSLFLLLNRFSIDEPVADSGANAPAAYLLTGQGVEVHRDRAKFIAAPATVLRGEDQIHLGPNTQATFITPAGMTRLNGPQTTTVAALASGSISSSGVPVINNSFSNEASRIALFQPRDQFHAAPLLVARRGAHSIPLYSPAGATVNLTPRILWKNQPGKTYDLMITDEFNPKAAPLRLHGVVSPVEFSKVLDWRGRSLATNGLYRIRITETGRPVTASEYTFRTLALVDVDGQIPDPLANALSILTSDPSRTGDALADLLALPKPMASSELALRLKLLALGQLGYKDDFEATLLLFSTRE